MLSKNTIYQLYLELRQKHGSPKKFWPQWCAREKTEKDRELIIIGAILTQRTNWRNVELALANLKKCTTPSIEGINRLGRDNFQKLEELIRPAGFYHQKTHRLFGFCRFIIKEYGSLKNFSKVDLTVARQKLLCLNGIGPETADTILLYALDKQTFVIDEYTKRLVQKRKLAKKFTYDYLKALFEKNLPPSVQIYQDFHTLIIVEQKGEANSRMEKI